MAEWLDVDWGTVARVVTGTLAIYATVLIGVRVAGRRTLAEMSAFDFVVTVALGSIIAQASASAQSPVRGMVAVAVLLGLQVVVAALRRASGRVERIFDFAPRILVDRGRVDNQMLAVPQMTVDDVMSKLRQHGAFRPEDVELAVLEANGKLSVVLRRDKPGEDTVAEVRARMRGGDTSND